MINAQECEAECGCVLWLSRRNCIPLGERLREPVGPPTLHPLVQVRHSNQSVLHFVVSFACFDKSISLQDCTF